MIEEKVELGKWIFILLMVSDPFFEIDVGDEMGYAGDNFEMLVTNWLKGK